MAGANQKQTFSISEETRISFTTQLRKLREDDSVDEVRFPSTLDNVERKFLHHLAGQLGLVSKSRGKADKRYITVYKANKPPPGQDDDDDGDSLPVLALAKDAADVLSAHVARYRISDDEKELLSGAGSSEAAHRVHHMDGDGGRRSHKKSTSKEMDRLTRIRESYAAAQQRRSSNPKYRSVLDGRKRLPAWSHAETVARLVKENQVVIISGDTGCGKSTQVPQFILDDPEMGPSCRMAVTQPRRISAIAVAERIASERMEEVGKVIGYNIRLETEVSDTTQVTFMTPGVLLRKLASDSTLSGYSHVVIDEVHERDRNTDFLLIVLRDLLPSRPELRVILMSATLQSSKLAVYFGGCPVAVIGSTMYPVQEFFLEDVLLQTEYVKANATKSDPLLRALCKTKPVYTCDMCKRRGFRSPEEYGTHVVLCDGGSKAVDYRALEMRLLKDLKDDRGFVQQYADDEADDWYEKPLLQQPGPEDVVVAAEEEESAPSRHDPGVGGICPMAKATEVQAQEVLRAYQFDWDDEMVDYNLIRELLMYICESGYEQGAILVFLPGWDDISRLRDLMKRDSYFGHEGSFLVLPLHSGIPSKMQREVFKRPPPGARKVVLATNIAETSITIDDVSFVVDTCRVKEKTYDPYLKMCTLSATWISKASARQRRGRAGRTTAGVCFHLCSRRRYEALREFRESELLTTPLEELVLQAKALGVAPGGAGMSDDASVRAFLGKALDPPHALAVKNAIDLLQQIGALTGDEQLTELGWKLANMPMDPKIGKMVLWGQLLGCGKSALKVGCGMAYRDPFVLPLSSDQKSRAEKAKQELADGTMSDHLALVNALNYYEKAIEKGGVSESIHFCDRFFLSKSTLSTVLDVVRQMVSEMGGLGFESPFRKGPANENDSNFAVLAAVICAGLYPGVARRNKLETNFVTVCGKKSKIHGSSVNFFSGSRFTRPCPQGPEFLVFSEVLRTPQLYLMSNTTPVPVMNLMLLSGTLRVRGTESLLVSATVSGGMGTTPRSSAEVVAKPSPAAQAGGAGLDDDDDDDDGAGMAVLNLEDWVAYRCAPELAVQIQLLRLRLQQAFVQFIQHPQSRLSEVHQDAIRAAVKVLTVENTYIPFRLKGDNPPLPGGHHPGSKAPHHHQQHHHQGPSAQHQASGGYRYQQSPRGGPPHRPQGGEYHNGGGGGGGGGGRMNGGGAGGGRDYGGYRGGGWSYRGDRRPSGPPAQVPGYGGYSGRG